MKTALGACYYKYYKVDFSTAGYSTAPPYYYNTKKREKRRSFSLSLRDDGTVIRDNKKKKLKTNSCPDGRLSK